MVGKAWDKPRRRLCTKGERSVPLWGADFLVNNMWVSKDFLLKPGQRVNQTRVVL